MSPARHSVRDGVASGACASTSPLSQHVRPPTPGERALVVGRARLDVFNIGDITLPLGPSMRAPADADGPRRARVESLLKKHRLMPMQDVLVRHESEIVLVDAGAYDITPDSPYHVAGYAPPPSLVQRLTALGVNPDAVRHVVITHRHWDHFNATVAAVSGGPPRPTFSRARHYVHRRDWNDITARLSDTGSREARCFGPFLAAGLLEVVDGDHRIAPGLDVLAAPGETAGHQVLRVSSNGSAAFCVGDLIHHPLEVAKPGFMVSWADEPSNRASRARIFGEAAELGARLVASHIRAIGTVVRGDAGLRWSDTLI